MSRDTLILIELLLVFGGVLGFGVWQVWSVRRSLRQDRERQPLPEPGDGEAERP